MAIYQYKCDKGHITEERHSYDVESIPCPKCKRIARRVAIYKDQTVITETGVGH